VARREGGLFNSQNPAQKGYPPSRYGYPEPTSLLIMADTDDPLSSSSPGGGDTTPTPAAKVIPLAGRERRAPAAIPAQTILLRELRRLRSITRALPIPELPANDAASEPGESEDGSDLEREDLERRIAEARRDVERGKRRAAQRLAALRSLHAMQTFQRGDRAAAYEEWEALIAEEPRSCGTLLERALHFEVAKELDIALADYDRAAARRPHDPEVYLARGRCFIQRRDWERALADFRRLVHLRPRDVTALEDLASALRFTGDADAAIRVMGRAIKLAPWRPHLYAFRAACFGARDMLAEQLVDLDRCIELSPTNAEALRDRASLHSRRDDHERAFADLSRAIELDPSHAGSFQSRAYHHKRRGRMDLAIADFSQAIALKPECEPLLRSRAEACLKEGSAEMAEMALADLNEVMSLDGRPSAETYWLRGHAYRKRGDLARARADYDEAMSLDWDRFDELQRRMRLHRQLSFTAELLDELETLLVIDPSDVDALAEHAKLLSKAGEHARALTDLDRAIELDPERGELFHQRAEVLRSMRKLKKALEDESRAVELAPHVAEHHAWRGLYRVRLEGASEEAEADLKRALGLEPDDLTILFYYAYYFERAGRYEEAVKVHSSRIEIEPDIGLLYVQRAEARLLLPESEAALRAALGDYDAAIERGYKEPEVLEARAAVLARLAHQRPPPASAPEKTP
jgi:tetratricopeptide (TPR) repeat protein